jgi:cellulose biosynthesis protein BcsQ
MTNECFVVAFVSGKGGTGKTTLTANFAIELASASRARRGEILESKNRVLVIDNDYATGGSSYLLAGGERLRSGVESNMIQPNSCFYDCYSNHIPPNLVAPLRLLFEDKTVGEFQVDVLLNSLAWWRAPLPGSMSEDEQPEIALEPHAEGFMDRNLLPYYESLMGRFRKEYDYIIIDSRGGADTRASVAAVVADSIVIVTEPGDVAGKQDLSFVHSLRTLSQQIGRSVGGVSIIYNRVLGSERDQRKEKRPSDLTVIGRLPISETVVQCYRNTELVFERKPLDPFCIEAIRAFESRFPGEVGLCQLRSKRAKLLLAVRTIAYRSSQVLARLVVFLALLLGIWLVMLAGQPNGLWLASMIPMVLFGGGVLIATGVHQATGAEKLFPRILWGLLGTCALGLSLFIAVELGILISRL